MKARKGFTLMELLVVVLVLSTLAGIMVPRIIDFQKAGKRSNCKANIANLKKAIERYAIDSEGVYPAAQSAFNTLFIGASANIRYFPHGGPVCPYNATYIYDTVGKTVTNHDHSGD